MNKKFLAVLLFLSLIIPGQVLAICGGPIVSCGRDLNDNGVIDPYEACKLCDIFELIENILVFILTCAVPLIATVMLVWGGFMFFSSVESPGKVEDAKNIIKAVVIGMVIIFLAWVFLNSFLTTIGVAEWTGLKEGWWKIQCN